MMQIQERINKNQLFQLISSCINTFKKIPKLIQSCIENNGCSYLTNLLMSANNIVQLCNHIIQYIPDNQQYVQIFHRFYCRLRQIIYSYLRLYIKINGKMFVRDFLVQANKQVLSYKPESDPTLVLQKVYLCIIKYIKCIAVAQNMKNQQIQLILKERKIFKKKPQITSNKQQPLYLRQKGLPKNIKDQLQTKNLIKSNGIDVISNLDFKHIQKFIKQPQQQLFKNYTFRNKNIKMQISRYSANYELFQSKPQQKKNRSYSQFQSSKLRPASGRKKIRQKKFSKQKNSLSVRKSTIYQSVTYQNTSDQIIRQQLLQQITQRKKFCPAKVIVAGSDLSFKPIPYSNKTIKGQSSTKFYKRAKKGAKIGFQLYSQATRSNSISYPN